MIIAAARDDHRAFLNRYYGASRAIYDVTRRYYLFGRDTLLDELVAAPIQRVVEVGPGTGRNLRVLHRRRPDLVLGGVDASDAMLEHARARCPWARLHHGFAEDADLDALVGGRPDRVLLSYCLSMVGDARGAIEHARRAVGPQGEVSVVDFADLGDLPGPLRRALRAWLRTFHVEPLDASLFEGLGARLTWGPGRYWVIARIPGTAD